MFRVKVKIPANPSIEGRPSYWYERPSNSNFKTVEEMSAWLRRMHQVYTITSCHTQHVTA